MRSEDEIRQALDDCRKVQGFGLSEGPCPRESDGSVGCCAECSFPSAVKWVLGDEGNGSDNGQDNLINALRSANPGGKIDTDDMPTVFSFFSGAGGMDIGFKQAGFSLRLSNDNDLESSATLGQITKRPHVEYCGDIRGLSFQRDGGDVVASWMTQWDNQEESTTDTHRMPAPDVVIGGPPCQAFSVAGRQNPDDPRATLVGQFARVVREIMPRCFVMENVSELLTSNKPHAIAAKTAVLCLYDAGYLITTHVLNARDFGLPQSRKRVFFVGMLNPLPHLPASAMMPFQLPPRTARSVLLEIGRAGRGQVPNAKIVPAKNPILRGSPYGGMLFNGKGRPINLDECSGTLPASMGGNRTPIIDDEELYDGKEPWVKYYHSHLMDCGLPLREAPAFLRRMTVIEAAAFQGFPSGFLFAGSQSSQYRQIGNAVPPPMAKAVAEAIRLHIKV